MLFKNHSLSFSILYQSVLKYCTNYDQVLTVHCLFYNEIIDKNNFTDLIAAGTITDYVKGNRQVRADLISKCCNYSDQDLISIIQKLNIQDINVTVEAIKSLLTVVNISEELRDRLLKEADLSTDKSLFVGHIFQESLKCTMPVYKLKKDDLDDLKSIWMKAVSGDNNPLVENENVSNQESNMEKEFQISPPTDAIGDLEQSENSTYMINRDSIDLWSYMKNDPFGKRATKRFIYKFDLPDDYENIFIFAAPFLQDSSDIPIDLADIFSVTDIDETSKLCKSGSVVGMAIYCEKDRLIKEIDQTFFPMNIDSIIVMIQGDFELDYVQCITEPFYKINLISSIKYNTNIPNEFVDFRMLIHVETSVPEFSDIHGNPYEKTEK